MIGALRNISAILLVIIVVRGVLLYDSRFTILLLPPFLLWYTRETPGWFLELPVVSLVAPVVDNMSRSFGVWPVRILFAAAGVVAGLYMGGGIKI